MNEIKETINYNDFAKLDIRVGTIIEVDRVEKSNKLLRLIVDFGENIGKRQILSGIAKSFEPEDLLNKQTTFVLNLEPRSMMGLESNGMLFAIDDENGKTILFNTEKPVTNGLSAC